MYRTGFYEKLQELPGYRRFMRLLLYGGLFMSVVGLLLKFVTHTEGGTIMLITGFGTLSVVFFSKAYEMPAMHPYDEMYDMEGAEVPNDVRRMIEESEVVNQMGGWMQKLAVSHAYRCFVHKILWWGLAVLIIGLLFKICHWPGGFQMLVIGIGSTVIALLSLAMGYFSLPESWKGHKELF